MTYTQILNGVIEAALIGVVVFVLANMAVMILFKINLIEFLGEQYIKLKELSG